MNKTFTVAYDAGYEAWIVLSTETKAKSFAMVPATDTYLFDRKADAVEQAKELTGKAVAVRMIETPDRFEAVEDIIYGSAWE